VTMFVGEGEIRVVGDKLHDAIAVKMNVDWQEGAVTGGLNK